MAPQNLSRTKPVDWTTIAIYAFLVLLGWLNIYAAVFDENHSSIFDISQRYGKQMLWIGASIILAAVIMLLDSKFYTIFSIPIYGFTLLLLLLVLIAGTEVNGARSWIMLGDFQIQPTEFAKIGTCLALAKLYGDETTPKKPSTQIALSLAILALPMLLIMCQPDAGSALVYASFAFALYRQGMPGWVILIGFLAVFFFVLVLLVEEVIIYSVIIACGILIYTYISKKYKQILQGIGIGGIFFTLLLLIRYISSGDISIESIMPIAIIISGVTLFIIGMSIKDHALSIISILACVFSIYTTSVDFVFNNLLEPHQRQRVHILLGIENDPLGYGYNVNQAKIAIGSGGFFGKGFLQGTQTKFDFVPEQSTDFIFCTVGEEWGFVGSTILVILFCYLIYRILFIAERQKSSFSRVYGYGVAGVFFIHFFVNIGMAIGLLPVIGIPLPFFSYGGSSLWTFTILLFILLKLDTNREELIW